MTRAILAIDPGPRKVASLTIPGEPVAQGRGRAVRVGKGTRVVDPPKSRNWKAYASAVMRDAIDKPLTGPIGLTVTAYWACPVGLHRKREPRPEVWRPKKPDIDNVLKAVLDAGNGVLWVDDSQVVSVTGLKVQAEQGEPPRVEVEVWDFDTRCGEGVAGG